MKVVENDRGSPSFQLRPKVSCPRPLHAPIQVCFQYTCILYSRIVYTCIYACIHKCIYKCILYRCIYTCIYKCIAMGALLHKCILNSAKKTHLLGAFIFYSFLVAFCLVVCANIKCNSTTYAQHRKIQANCLLCVCANNSTKTAKQHAKCVNGASG